MNNLDLHDRNSQKYMKLVEGLKTKIVLKKFFQQIGMTILKNYSNLAMQKFLI